MRKEDGFTLVELMLVVVIVGIMTAGGVLAMYNWRPGMQLRGAANDILSSIRRTQAHGVRQFTPTCIQYNLGAGRYIVFEDNGVPGVGGTRGNGVQDDLVPGDGIEDTIAIGRLPQAITFDVANCTIVAQRLQFNTKGLPVGATGTLVIQNANNQNRNIIVAAVTGRTRVQ